MLGSKNARILSGGNPERIAQIETLIGLIAEPDEVLPSSIFIYGHSSSGKKYIVTKIMKEYKLKYIVYNCVESYSSKLLFESILGLNSCSSAIGETGDSKKKNRDTGAYNQCDNLMDFIIRFEEKFRDYGKEEKIFIVLEKSERLRNMGDHILPVLLRLQELTGVNVCVILLSEVIWEKFYIKMGLSNPIQIFFPQYSKDEIIDILCSSYTSKYPKDFYRNYLNMFLSTFYRVSRNLVHIRLLAEKLFVEYCYPIEKGDIKIDDVSNLWRWIVPHIKRALQLGYLNNEQQRNEIGSLLLRKSDDKLCKIPSINLDLPFHSKMLLISAYLASHNSSKSDQMVFSKRKIKQKKKTKKSLSVQRNIIKGPKPFHFDRMMAIFYCINENEKLHTSLLMSQVSYLLSLHLMDTFGDDMLDEPKYICTANFDMVSNIARSVDFNIVKLLCD